MSFIWVIIGAVVILGLLSGGNKSNSRKSETNINVRIDHPHLIDDDDYECSTCHERFRKNTMVCPHCGTRFTEKIEDSEEWDEEEDELEAWDEEEGI